MSRRSSDDSGRQGRSRRAPRSGPSSQALDRRPDKSLGQCFLTDPRIADRIVELAEISPDDRVAEIGPGRGILTRPLASRAGSLVAIELDRRWHAELAAAFDGNPKVQIVHGDALEFPFEDIPAPFKVVANLPYYIATPLLFRMLECRSRINLMVLMLQQEVVERMVAGPGSDAYGALSVAVAYASEARRAFRVSPGSFSPRPAVSSMVVTVKPRDSPPIAVRDEGMLFRVVRAAFGHRRKMLGNALRDAGFDPAKVTSGIQQTGIDGRRRGETLSLREFGLLADALTET